MASGDQGFDRVEQMESLDSSNIKKNETNSSVQEFGSDEDDRDKSSNAERNASYDMSGLDPLSAEKVAKSDRKIGHRRVGVGGEITYKKIQSTQIMGSIQLGIQHAVGGLASKPERDLLMQDFMTVETTNFPNEGSNHTQAHRFSEFRFKAYAPIAFRYFRDLFGIQPEDYLLSMCSSPLRELSNPGASGSIFYLTEDDEFIIKTVQHKEGEFLQKLLPGYYLNLNQNPRTLLPKFFGLYCYQCNSKNVRLVAMNNLLPSVVKLHQKYDLKGSTYKRKASKSERKKKSPTYKDLDFMEHHPDGILLEADTYGALVKTIQRDCMVLESFKIMDYSLLVGIHNLDDAQREKAEAARRAAEGEESGGEEGGAGPTEPTHALNRTRSEHLPGKEDFGAQVKRTHYHSPDNTRLYIDDDENDETLGVNVPNSQVDGNQLQRDALPITGMGDKEKKIMKPSINRQRLVAHSTAMESIQAESEPIDEEEDVPPGGIPARNARGERLLLFVGIIDILQSYRLRKKLEHSWKSMIHDGDTVSVHKPGFYAQRFQNFMSKTVFKKIPSPLKHSPSKRKSITRPIRAPDELDTPGVKLKFPSVGSELVDPEFPRSRLPFNRKPRTISPRSSLMSGSTYIGSSFVGSISDSSEAGSSVQITLNDIEYPVVLSNRNRSYDPYRQFFQATEAINFGGQNMKRNLTPSQPLESFAQSLQVPVRKISRDERVKKFISEQDSTKKERNRIYLNKSGMGSSQIEGSLTDSGIQVDHVSSSIERQSNLDEIISVSNPITKIQENVVLEQRSEYTIRNIPYIDDENADIYDNETDVEVLKKQSTTTETSHVLEEKGTHDLSEMDHFGPSCTHSLNFNKTPGFVQRLKKFFTELGLGSGLNRSKMSDRKSHTKSTNSLYVSTGDDPAKNDIHTPSTVPRSMNLSKVHMKKRLLLEEEEIVEMPSEPNLTLSARDSQKSLPQEITAKRILGDVRADERSKIVTKKVQSSITVGVSESDNTKF